MDIAQLNKNHAFNLADNSLNIISGEAGILLVKILNRHASAVISLQGAHLLSWIPTGEEEVIWLSGKAVFAPGKSIRGGIPVCWPWFGQYSGTQQASINYPAHGFARTADWQILHTEALDDGCTRISLTMQPQPATQIMWPVETSVQLQITIGKKLEIELITHNNGSRAISIGQALHTYFKVADISNVLLHGLDDTDYLDKLDDYKRKHQHGALNFVEEVDRIYLGTSSDCVIEDKILNRNIIIIKCGSHSTVVWNPWQETASKMGDVGEAGYKNMLCVESSNVAEDIVTIEPGKAHQLWAQYEVQSKVE